MRIGAPTIAVPATAAVIAALGAPALLGAPVETGLCAGAVVAFVVSGGRLAFARARRAPAAPRILAAGLLLAAAGAALPMLPGAPPWLQPAILLAAALAVGTGAALAVRSLEDADAEATDLRDTLARREGDVRAQAERLRRVDQFDPATGLLHRRAFAAAAAEALETCAAVAAPLALILVELRESRPTLDPRNCGRAVRAAVRGSDVAGVWERNLLALLLPRCHDPKPAVRRLAARLEEAGARPGVSAHLAGVTISSRGPWPDAEGLMASASAALAAARRAPAGADVALWPIDWGLAAAESGTGPLPAGARTP